MGQQKLFSADSVVLYSSGCNIRCSLSASCRSETHKTGLYKAKMRDSSVQLGLYCLAKPKSNHDQLLIIAFVVMTCPNEVYDFCIIEAVKFRAATYCGNRYSICNTCEYHHSLSCAYDVHCLIIVSPIIQQHLVMLTCMVTSEYECVKHAT